MSDADAAVAAEPVEALFDPFSAAEAASEEIIDLILVEGGKILYEHYVERKSYPFAAGVATSCLVNELKLRFVRFDPGEPGAANRCKTASPEQRGDEMSEHDMLIAAVSSQAEPSQVPGSPRESWTLEPEPSRCRIDTWARACVPIRKKMVQPKVVPIAEDLGKSRKRGISRALSSSTSQGRAPSRSGTNNGLWPTQEDQGNASAKEKARPQVVPLPEEKEESDSEAEMREKKDREARRKREEEGRQQVKAAAQAEEVARMAQVKDQMKNKPFTYDSQGNIIWIQPPNLAKMPAPVPQPSFSCRRDDPTAGQDQVQASPREAAKRRSSSQGKRKGRKGEDFSDSFRRFASQQPPMIESMNLVPGVALSERGRTRSGKPDMPKPGAPMTRREYEAMAHSGRKPKGPKEEKDEGSPRSAVDAIDGEAPGGEAQQALLSAGGAAAPASAAVAVATPVAAAMDDVVARLPKEAIAGGATPGAASAGGMSPGAALRVVRAGEMGKELVARAPAAPRPMQAVPPPSFRRVQMKRDALGYCMSTRERVETQQKGASRYPNCAPQPPVGATMGHGLATGVQRPEEFYFPGASGVVFGESSQEDPGMRGAPSAAGMADAYAQLADDPIGTRMALHKRLYPRG